MWTPVSRAVFLAQAAVCCRARSTALLRSGKAASRILLHQSDLAAASRCLAEYGYRRAGVPDATNSAAAYGSVMHHAISAMERELAEGVAFKDAVEHAKETFQFFWHPLNITAICEPVPADGWLPRQDYSSLRAKGLEVIAKYADLIRFDDKELLGTEFSFVVPVDGTWDDDLGEPHHLAGTIDRLAVRWYKRFETVAVDDYKSGYTQAYLRWNNQGTSYSYASTKLDFWLGFDGIVNGVPMREDGFGADRGQQLHERFLNAPRRFTWVDLRNVKFVDGGWRGPDDYTRFALAVQQFADLVRSEIFPLSLSGATCKHCAMRRICGGVGLPAVEHGAPAGVR